MVMLWIQLFLTAYFCVFAKGVKSIVFVYIFLYS